MICFNSKASATKILYLSVMILQSNVLVESPYIIALVFKISCRSLVGPIYLYSGEKWCMINNE